MSHEPVFQLSAETHARGRIFFDGLKHGIDLVEPPKCCRRVALRDFNNVIDDSNEIPLKERVPDEAHQVLREIAARWARAPAVTFEASPTGSH